jgi:hypothetical protein
MPVTQLKRPNHRQVSSSHFGAHVLALFGANGGAIGEGWPDTVQESLNLSAAQFGRLYLNLKVNLVDVAHIEISHMLEQILKQSRRQIGINLYSTDHISPPFYIDATAWQFVRLRGYIQQARKKANRLHTMFGLRRAISKGAEGSSVTTMSTQGSFH